MTIGQDRSKKKDRLLPYKLLAYFMFGKETDLTWIYSLGSGLVKIETGPASRDMYVRVSQFWDALEWLDEHSFIKIKSGRGERRGTCILKLVTPPNL